MGNISPYYQDDTVTLYCADCRSLDLSGITAVVTDPPYELGFMGKHWDKQGVSFDAETWRRISGYCLPGAPLLSFGGPRTWHRLVCAIEDAGWEIRDTLMWLYGSGFPKSLDISKAIDKAAGAEREVIGPNPNAVGRTSNKTGGRLIGGHEEDRGAVDVLTAPATDAAKEWQGYGTALKPAWEPICLAMKPLDGTYAHNALTHGAAGLNIDGARIPLDGEADVSARQRQHDGTDNGFRFAKSMTGKEVLTYKPEGRWPANLILDEEAAAMLDEQSGESTSRSGMPRKGVNGNGWGMTHTGAEYDDHGGPSRFFYCAKASRAERDAGCEGLEVRPLLWSAGTQNPGSFQSANTMRAAKNDHPTVKPLALMTYLVKLISPPSNAVILDPFMGSGTTGLACRKLGVRFIGVDISEHNCEIALKRMGLQKPVEEEQALLF